MESADTGQSELGNLVKDPGEDSVDKTGVIFLSLVLRNFELCDSKCEVMYLSERKSRVQTPVLWLLPWSAVYFTGG